MNNTATNTATCPTVRKQIGKTRTAGNQNRLSGFARDEKSRTFSSNSKRSHILRISSRTMRTAKSRIGDRLVTEKDGTAWVCYLRN